MSNRRGTMLNPIALTQLWDSVEADICKNFNEHRASRKEYLVNSYVDFEDVAKNITGIMKRLLQILEISFPSVFVTTPLEIQHRPARQATLTTRDSGRSSATSRLNGRTRSSVRTRTPTNATEASKWSCMDYSRTVGEWRYQKITTMSSQMKQLTKHLARCSEESEEKFTVMPLAWKLTDKHAKTHSHYSCIVVDLAPNRVAKRDIEVIIIDVNGYGNSSTAYKSLFKEPAMGLNPFIQVIVTSLFSFAKDALGFENLRVSFPAFSGINVSTKSAIAAIKREETLFPGIFTNVHMEKGVCSIATLFVIIRLACDQRKVFREGIDTTLKRFTKSSEGGVTEYRHLLFVRAFTYSLMNFLELDTKQYGIKGDPYIVAEASGAWSIRRPPGRR